MSRTEDQVADSIWARLMMNGFVPAKFTDGRLGLLVGGIASELADEEELQDTKDTERRLSTCSLDDETNVENLSSPFHWRIPASQSRVYVTITRKDAVGDVNIPIGTIVGQVTRNPIQYAVSEGRVLYADLNSIVVMAVSVDYGANTMVGPGELTEIEKVSGVTVTNKESSWGGRDKETIDSVKQKALGFRYDMEKNNETVPVTAAKERTPRKTTKRIDETRNQKTPALGGIVKSQLPLKAIMPAMKKTMYCGKKGN